MKSIVLLLCITISLNLDSQIGGFNTYKFLELPASSRVTALGGAIISVNDDDVNLALANPALLNESMDGKIAINHNFHFAGISNGYLAIGKNLSKYKIATHLGLGYINYGEFIGKDEYEVNTSNFNASEKFIVIGAAKQINERMSLGLNIKPVFSEFENYNSIGITTDAGLNYHNESKKLALSFVVKNLGKELLSYNESKLNAPLDLQIGLSKRLEHLPMRISIVAHQLQRWDVRYDDPSEDTNNSDIFGTVEQSSFSKFIDNFFRHFIFNTELLLGKSENFRLRAGYNHYRRKELSLSTFRSLAGFSLGFGIKIKKFRLDYGLGYYHLAGATNHLSISTSIKEFKKSSSN
jgi:hypothetical protein